MYSFPVKLTTENIIIPFSFSFFFKFLPSDLQTESCCPDLELVSPTMLCSMARHPQLFFFSVQWTLFQKSYCSFRYNFANLRHDAIAFVERDCSPANSAKQSIQCICQLRPAVSKMKLSSYLFCSFLKCLWSLHSLILDEFFGMSTLSSIFYFSV